MRAEAATAFAAARTLLLDAHAARAFPAAVIEVGARDRVIWTEAIGALTYDAGAPPATLDTIFDLASLTKVTATLPSILSLIADGRLGLDAPVGLAPRMERLVLIVAGIGLAGLGIGIGLIGAMAIVAILAVATTIQRIWHVHRLSSATPAVATNEAKWEK